MSNKPGKTYIVTPDDFEDSIYNCAHTRFVRGNPLYSAIADTIFPFYEHDDDTLNACAFHLSEMDMGSLKENNPQVDWSRYHYGIMVYGGMLRWVTVLGHVCEYLARTEELCGARQMLKWMGANVDNGSGEVGRNFVRNFLDEFTYDTKGTRVEMTRSYALAVLNGLIGHEMGHVCLGHCADLSDPYSNRSMGRIIEREADLFTTSIAHSMSNGEIGAIGTVMMDISFTWLRDVKKPNHYGTHPDPTERVRNMIESFNAILSESRVTGKMLQKLCR